VEWQDSNGESGEYRSERKAFGVLRDAEHVTLSAKVGGVESIREEWLVLHAKATPPNDVIERLLLEAKDVAPTALQTAVPGSDCSQTHQNRSSINFKPEVGSRTTLSSAEP
jgi:hypothetical protein